MNRQKFFKIARNAFFFINIAGALNASATVVQLQTVMGNIDINLFDTNTPKTVQNFLTYVNAGSYSNSIIHRSEPGFVIQGGGYTYSGSIPLGNVAQNAAVINEPVYSNVRGTIAMAKVSGNANSATNQWFINLADNSANLDVQNSGFSVFGKVSTEGMVVADAIAALYTASTDVGNMPLRNFTAADYSANKTPTADNFVIITAITVKDSTVNSAATITPAPTPNTLITSSSSSSTSTSNNSSGGGGGGSTSAGLLIGLALLFSRNILARFSKNT